MRQSGTSKRSGARRVPIGVSGCTRIYSDKHEHIVTLYLPITSSLYCSSDIGFTRLHNVPLTLSRVTYPIASRSTLGCQCSFDKVPYGGETACLASVLELKSEKIHALCQHDDAISTVCYSSEASPSWCLLYPFCVCCNRMQRQYHERMTKMVMTNSTARTRGTILAPQPRLALDRIAGCSSL
jgi:hypothetical protein